MINAIASTLAHDKVALARVRRGGKSCHLDIRRGHVYDGTEVRSMISSLLT